VSVTIIAALVVPSATVPNATVVADSLVGTSPDPVSFTVSPLLLALSAMVSVPAGCAPVAVGVKLKERVQLAPPAKGVAVEQVVAGPSANSPSPDTVRELNVTG
jgi:hypothetical protein